MTPVPRRQTLFVQLARLLGGAETRSATASRRIYEELDTWHEVGEEADSSLTSPWVGDPGFPPQFLLDPAGVVHLRGVMTRAAPATDATLSELLRLPGDLAPVAEGLGPPYSFFAERENLYNASALVQVRQLVGGTQTRVTLAQTGLPALKGGQAAMVDLAGIAWVRKP
jgi:hypothetical protein